MILEDLYGIDLLEPHQHGVYRAIRRLLTPISQSAVDYSRTQMMVRHLFDCYELQVSIVPAGTGFPISIEMQPTTARIALGGWRQSYSTEKTPILTAHEMADTIVDTTKRAIFGHIKIVEHQVDGRSYRWERYDYIDGNWRFLSRTNALVLNVFGKKTTVELLCALT